MPDEPEQKHDLIGKTLGEYEIIEVIGEGGMAVVFRARQPSMNRVVALKVITARIQERDAFIERFTREAKFLAGLEHPNILPVYSFSTETTPIYLVMRLISGSSLDKYIRAHALTSPQIVQITNQIASALDFVHRRGIVHRDLKPNNILLDENIFPYLMDFGIARTIQDTQHRLTTEGNIVGTPAYMAPEQWGGGSIDGRTDQYAFGIMVYEMFTGVLPFSGDTPYAIMYQHLERPLPPIRTIRPDLPEGLDAVIRKATEKRAEDRYPSTLEFARAVEAVIATAPLNTGTPISGTPIRKPSLPAPIPASDLNAGTLAVTQAPKPTNPANPVDQGFQYVVVPEKRKGLPRRWWPVVGMMVAALVFGVFGAFVTFLARQNTLTPTSVVVIVTRTATPVTETPSTAIPPSAVPTTAIPIIAPTSVPTTIPPTSAPTIAPATVPATTVAPTTLPPTSSSTYIPPTITATIIPPTVPATRAPTLVSPTIPPTSAVTLAPTIPAGPTFSMVVFRNVDALSLYIPGAPTNPATVSFKGLSLETQNARGDRLKAEFSKYPALIGLPFYNLPTPICFNFKLRGSTAALPLECRQLPANTLFQQTLTAANLIWYDSVASEARTVFLMRGTTLIAQCPAASQDCTWAVPIEEGN